MPQNKTTIFSNLFSNIASLYKGRNLLWQIIFIFITYVCVVSGFDWYYYESTRSVILRNILFPSAIIGFFIPVIVPIFMFYYSKIKNSERIRNATFATIQAGILGLGLSSFYKVFTGRMGPYVVNNIDISHMFRFGILRGGAFQGWPSSHTTTAFAMSMALVTLFPENKLVKYSAIIYAIYIGIGVSATIHWFSDFMAGAIFGTIIGISVGRSFLKKV